MLGGLCRAGGAARRAALSVESCLSPSLDATAAAAAAARRTLRGEAEKKPEELTSDQRRAAPSLGSFLSPRLAAIPAAADPNQRRAEVVGSSLSLLLAANRAAARRTLCTEPEKKLSPTDCNDIWLYNRLTQLETIWRKELHDLDMESLKMSKDLDDAVEAYRRSIAQAKATAMKDAMEKILGVGLLLSMALLVVRC